MKTARLMVIAAGILGFAPFVDGQISLGQMDDFEDGTTQDWSHGAGSPNPPANVADGGPGGPGDNFLQIVSSGGAGAGSKFASFNETQWTGDFLSNGITGLSAFVNNLGATTLELRLGFTDNTGQSSGNKFVSSTSINLAAGSGWTPVFFPIGSSDLTQVLGAGSYAATMADVAEMRLLSASVAAWQGDVIAATLGVDNLIAVPEPHTYGWIAAMSLLGLALIHKSNRKSRLPQ